MKLILALTSSGGISKEGKLPWKIPEETEFFKKMTLHSNVIMGRKTFESIGKLLPQRNNIIVGKGYTPLETAISKAIELEKNGETVWVIGGSQIAEAFQPYIQESFYSIVNKEYECDVFAPQYVLKSLQSIQRTGEKCENCEKDECAFRVFLTREDFTVYQCFYNKNNEELQFQELVQKIWNEGVYSLDRTQIGTKSLFGSQLRFSLLNGKFPISTIRKGFFKGIFEELMWFLRGQTDSRILSQKGVKIWEDNSSRACLDNLNLHHLEEGDCGSIYGFQWRHWGAKYIDCKTDYTGQGIDQISNLISQIRTNPFSRRLLLSGWNVEDLNQMCLPPCHTFYQFNVEQSNDGSPNFLSCHYYQRSNDFILAGHWNITSASLLTILIAHFCNLRPKEVIVSYGNVHIYNNHNPKEYLQRFPFEYPTLQVSPKREITNLWDYQFEDVKLENYLSHPHIKFDMNS